MGAGAGTGVYRRAACSESVGAVAQWQAMALGDACLFQVRGADLIACFPVTHAADFGTTPALLSTRHDYNRRSLEALGTCAGACAVGDLFVLATDALEPGSSGGWRRASTPGSICLS